MTARISLIPGRACGHRPHLQWPVRSIPGTVPLGVRPESETVAARPPHVDASDHIMVSTALRKRDRGPIAFNLPVCLRAMAARMVESGLD